MEHVVVENESFTVVKFICVIMEGLAMPFTPFIREDFGLKQDHLQPKWLTIIFGSSMYHPRIGKDVVQKQNSIEHVADVVGSRVRGRIPPPANVEELKMTLVEEWDSLPQETIYGIIQDLVLFVRGFNDQ